MRYPSDVEDIFFNPAPLQGTSKLDSVWVFSRDSWALANRDKCIWDQDMKMSVWRHQIYNSSATPVKICSYRYDPLGRLLSYLRTGSSITDSMEFQEFRYDNDGHLSYNYNFDRTHDLGWAPILFEYEYDNRGNLVSVWNSSWGSSSNHEIYDTQVFTRTKYSYDTTAQLVKSEYYYGNRTDSMHLSSMTLYTRDTSGRLIQRQEYKASDNDSLKLSLDWFAYYSLTGLTDSIVSIYHTFLTSTKVYYTYDNNGILVTNTFLSINLATRDTTVSKYKYDSEITINENVTIGYRFDEGIWKPSSYNRSLVDSLGRLTLKENWIYSNGRLSVSSDQEKREEFEWTDNGMLAAYRLYNEYPQSISTPPYIQFRFFWSEASSLGVESSSNQLSMQVFPNPAQGQVTLHFPGPNPDFLVRIFSPSGALIKSIRVSEPSYNLDLSGLSEGIYWIDAVNAKTRFTTKLIKLNP